MNKIFLCLVLVLGAGASARAQVMVTATATAINTNLGYNSGSTYTFTYTLAGSFSSNASSYFDATHNYWLEYHVPQDSLYSSVTGDGLAGSYIRPVFDDTDPHSFLKLRTNGASDFLEMTVASQHGDIGLTANGAVIWGVYLQLSNSGATFVYSGSYDDPGAILAGSAGTYDPTAGSVHGLTVYSAANGYADFSVSSVTISAIPEPTTYVGLAGIGALGLVLIRRRRVT